VNSKQHIFFWLATTIILVLLFSTSLSSLVLSFYFVSFLLPVAIGTSACFNQILVPRYWILGRVWMFALYFVYLLIVSVYLEMLIIVLAFVILADYQIANLGKIASDIYLMAIVLYLIVFCNGLIVIFRSLKLKEKKIEELEQEKLRNKIAYLKVRIDRKNTRIRIEDICYIESLSDYIQIHTSQGIQITKEKISVIQKDLPSNFLRIHRSFIVNVNKSESYNRESLQVGGQQLTIGRKYKKEVLAILDT